MNPATYGNCSYNFNGRRLQSFTKSGSTYNYIYDEQGLRTRKIAPGGSVTKYLYNGTKLAAEIAPNYRLDFLYDENDMLYGFVKDGSAKYFYARDMLQNILGIIDTNGSPVVIYQYTAYGTSTVLQDTAGLANINPFRFKGYYFDSESGMYYCHTRYYVPEWCRWLNADDIANIETNSLYKLNLFAYCENNPISHFDPHGESIIVLCAIAIGALIGGAVSTAIAVKQEKTGWELAKSILFGIAVGIATASLILAAFSAGYGALAVMAGKRLASLSLLGTGVTQIFALSAATYDLFAFGVAPLFNLEVPGIELGSTPVQIPNVQPTPPHPANK